MQLDSYLLGLFTGLGIAALIARVPYRLGDWIRRHVS